MTRFRTERGLDRLVNFSDATVAIAITILLLPLVDVAVEIEKESLGEVLGARKNLRVRETTVTAVTFAMVLVLSVIFPWVGIYWLLLLIPVGVATGVLRRRQNPHDAETPSS
jgi:uncharacterized membrane protein